MGERVSKDTAQRPRVWRQGGNAVKVQMELLVPDLSKIMKAERIEQMVLIQEWLSGIKALPNTNSYFLHRVFYLNRDKMTIFTSSRHVL
jgi:hypothetical protein